MAVGCCLSLLLAGALAAGSPAAARPAAPRSAGAAIDYRAMEDELLAAINALRTRPPGAIAVLEQRRRHFDGKVLRLPGEVALRTFEGAEAVDEAIEYLRRARPQAKLVRSAAMDRAAADHVRDLGRSGATSHQGSDGSNPSDRLRRYGRWVSSAGENIAFGPLSGRRMALQLLIDDGVASRAHRENLFKAAFSRVGIACGPHPVLRTVCVVDFAADYLPARR